MRIVLFQFYSPFAMPDYDEMGLCMANNGHDILITHMTIDKKLLVWNNGNEYIINIYPKRQSKKIRFKILDRRIINMQFMFNIRKWIKELNPDIFIINPAELMYVSLLPLLMPEKIKFILDIRQLGFFSGESLFIKFKNHRAKLRFIYLQKFIYDHICFATEEAAETVIGSKWNMKNVSVKKVGVNKLFFDEFTLNKKKIKILQLVYIGSLARVRKLEFLIDAVKELSQGNDQFHLTLIGPSEDTYYAEYISSLELSAFITIKEPVPYYKVPEILHQYDVAVAYVPDIPDWYYQPTLKVLEYCAAGMPVVASDNLPNRKIIKENITGCFFKNEISSFNQAILSLIQDNDLLDTITHEAASNRIGITWKEAALNYEKLILTL